MVRFCLPPSRDSTDVGKQASSFDMCYLCLIQARNLEVAPPESVLQLTRNRPIGRQKQSVVDLRRRLLKKATLHVMPVDCMQKSFGWIWKAIGPGSSSSHPSGVSVNFGQFSSQVVLPSKAFYQDQTLMSSLIVQEKILEFLHTDSFGAF
jgi:hypothetical protein